MTLLNANGSVVRRLIDAVWRDVQVNEESLTKGIFDLRRFCEEKAMTQIEIRTIRNVGYQLKVDIAPRSTIDASVKPPVVWTLSWVYSGGLSGGR